MAGPLRGSTARLAGFNTLESYGPAHQWADWHPKELYVIAKKATLNARQGIWFCTSDLKKDTYGRILWDCPDLARDQILKGFAHAMTVTAEPARAEYLEAQAQAIAARRGMWARGAPALIMTSLHSADEGGAKEGKTYNRIVSTRDGHSVRWSHSDRYAECQDVCLKQYRVDPSELAAAARALRQDPDLQDVLKTYSDTELYYVVDTFARFDRIDGLKDRAHEAVLEPKLNAQRDGSVYTRHPDGNAACMQYTDFTRRFGDSKAECLK